jgi:anaerobic sulfite reductase subunit C
MEPDTSKTGRPCYADTEKRTMKWTPDAEAAIKKVPYFVRNRVRARVQEYALKAHKRRITTSEVQAAQERFLTGLQTDIKGHQIDTCFGSSGCPNAIVPDWDLVDHLEALLQAADLLEFLKLKGIQEIRYHHQFRIAVAGCPNACSQPQIKDIGIIGAWRPNCSDESCTICEACVHGCREGAITLDTQISRPRIDMQRCVACGSCILDCPTGTLAVQAQGYRIQLGGKLGRHPRLARELPGIYNTAAIIRIVGACIDIYKSANQRGERFGEILRPEDFDELRQRFTDESLDCCHAHRTSHQ